MSNPSQFPPLYPGQQIQWLIEEVILLRRSLNAISGGGGGSTTLTQNQIAYGSATNEVTSSADLQFDGNVFSVGSVAGLPPVLTARLVDPFVQLGGGSGNQTEFVLDDATSTVGASSQGGSMLLLDKANNTYIIGNDTGTYLGINDDPAGYNVEIATAGRAAIQLRGGTDNDSAIGDVASNGNATKLVIDDANQTAIISTGASDNGLELDFGAGEYRFGAVGLGNNTRLQIDDTNKEVTILGTLGPLLYLSRPSAGTGSYRIGDPASGASFEISDSGTFTYRNDTSETVTVNLNNITGGRQRTEPDKDGQYTVGLVTGRSGALSGGTVTVTQSDCLPTSNIIITALTASAINTTNFSVAPGTGSFVIKDEGGAINNGLTFMYFLYNN